LLVKLNRNKEECYSLLINKFGWNFNLVNVGVTIELLDKSYDDVSK